MVIQSKRVGVKDRGWNRYTPKSPMCIFHMNGWNKQWVNGFGLSCGCAKRLYLQHCFKIIIQYSGQQPAGGKMVANRASSRTVFRSLISNQQKLNSRFPSNWLKSKRVNIVWDSCRWLWLPMECGCSNHPINSQLSTIHICTVTVHFNINTAESFKLGSADVINKA